MKQRIIWILILFISIGFQTASAELGNQGLIINDGEKVIQLEAGEKKKLWVRDGLSGILLSHGVTFYSDNDAAASIGENSGVLQAHFKGVAHITVMSSSGRSARIKVIIQENGKKRSPLLLFVFAPFLILIAFILRRK